MCYLSDDRRGMIDGNLKISWRSGAKELSRLTRMMVLQATYIQSDIREENGDLNHWGRRMKYG